MGRANAAGHGDTGGASRFYPVFRYQAKAPASERPVLKDGTAHETVKPLGFISWRSGSSPLRAGRSWTCSPGAAR